MRYPPLLIVIFLVVMFKPFADQFGSFSLSPSILLLLVFLTLIYAFRLNRPLFTSLIVLGIVCVASRFAADHWDLSSVEIFSQGSSFIAMVLVMIAILSEVLRARTASTDLVIGAVCLYVIIGFAWMFLYYTMYLFAPDSIFTSPGRRTVMASEAKFTELLYFSLGALTTLGSGSEETMTATVRRLAVVESMMAQIYLAVLISRLVGFSTSNDSKAGT
jgi:hypothetical protein